MADFISNYINATIKTSKLVLEGGCFEVDGKGTSIMTESCIINDNRNPSFSKEMIEKELKYLLGFKKNYLAKRHYG